MKQKLRETSENPRHEGFGRRELVSSLGLGSLAMLSGVGPAAAQTPSVDSTYEAVKKKGVLAAGVRFDYPPAGFLNKQGEPEGFGVDIAAEFAKRLGVDIQYVSVTAATRIPSLVGGHMDVGVEIPTITVQRQQTVDFSFPYLWDGYSILVRADSPTIDVKELKPPRKIGVMRGSNDSDLIKAIVPDANLVLYPDFATAVIALTQGIIDATGVSTSVGKKRVKENPALKLGNPLYMEAMGLTMRQNDSRWRNWLEFTLQRMWMDGVYQSIYKKWYDIEPEFTLWSGGPATLQAGIDKWDGKV